MSVIDIQPIKINSIFFYIIFVRYKHYSIYLDIFVMIFYSIFIQ